MGKALGFIEISGVTAAIDALDDPHDNVSADPATFMHSQSWADQHVRGNI